jgi:hypothetical protein
MVLFDNTPGHALLLQVAAEQVVREDRGGKRVLAYFGFATR